MSTMHIICVLHSYSFENIHHLFVIEISYTHENNIIEQMIYRFS